MLLKLRVTLEPAATVNEVLSKEIFWATRLRVTAGPGGTVVVGVVVVVVGVVVVVVVVDVVVVVVVVVVVAGGGGKLAGSITNQMPPTPCPTVSPAATSLM